MACASRRGHGYRQPLWSAGIGLHWGSSPMSASEWQVGYTGGRTLGNHQSKHASTLSLVHPHAYAWGSSQCIQCRVVRYVYICIYHWVLICVYGYIWVCSNVINVQNMYLPGTFQYHVWLEHVLTWDTGHWGSHSLPDSTLEPVWAPLASSCCGLLAHAPAVLWQLGQWALGGWASWSPRERAPQPLPPPQGALLLFASFSSFWPSVGWEVTWLPNDLQDCPSGP